MFGVSEICVALICCYNIHQGEMPKRFGSKGQASREKREKSAQPLHRNVGVIVVLAAWMGCLFRWECVRACGLLKLKRQHKLSFHYRITNISASRIDGSTQSTHVWTHMI